MSNEIQTAVRQATNLSVVLHPHPFASDVQIMSAVEGSTIAEIVAETRLPEVYRPYLTVWIDDREVPQSEWSTTRALLGQNVYVRVVPQKSGKDVFRAIAMIVITVVAVYTGQAWALNMGWSTTSAAGVTSLTLGGSIAAGLMAAGIATIGMLALNALIPPPGLKNNAQDEKYHLTGTSNQFAPFANIPRVFGKRRMFPMMAARPYSEIQGNDEYLRICLLVGWGPLAITNIKIGETPISAFSGVEYEIKEGWSTDTALTLFSRTVVEDSVSVRLEPWATSGYYPGGYGTSGDYYYYDTSADTYATNSPTSTNDWAQRTTAVNAVEFSIDITFPQGLFYFDSKGNQAAATVVCECQYRLVGATTWISAAWANSTDIGFNTTGQVTITASESSSIRRSGRVKLPSAGQYEVRVRRTTLNYTNKYVDLTWWSALRTIKADYPVNQKNVALIALRIKATNQLNGVPNSINCETQSYLPVYNGSTWTYTLTSNPAWAFADILRRRGGDTFMADSRIDLTTIQAWATACDATAPNASEPYWTFNGVIEGGSAIDAMKTISSNARAMYTMRDGKHSVVRDIQQTVPIQHITPRNSSNYSGGKTFLEYPHALRVTFYNKNNGWQQDERVVYYDGYTSSNATVFETLELNGCTSPTQAYREARYHMAVARLRPETHSVDMDIEALRCTLGDLVLFSHDAIGIGIQSSRIAATTVNVSSQVTAITLQDEIYFETGKTYGLRGRKSDGTSVLMPLTNPGTGYVTMVTLTTPISVASAPTTDDLVVFGETSVETAPMMVRKIEPSEDFKVTITLVDAQSGVYSADTGTIPAFTSYLSLPSNPGAGSVPKVYLSIVRSDDSVTLIGLDGTIDYRIYAEVQQPAGSYSERIANFEVQYRIQNSPVWTSLFIERSQSFCFIDRVQVGVVYELRSRGVAESGSQSEWSSIVTHTVLGKTYFGGSPTGFSATAISGGIKLGWTNPVNDDFWQVELYENASNNSTTATLVATTTDNTYSRLGLDYSNGIRYYWLKSVDTTGNKTSFVGPVSATALNKGVILYLSNDSASLSADANGTVGSFLTAVGTVLVFDGNTDVTASATLSASATYCTGTINTATNTPVSSQPKGYYAVTAMTADTAKLTITAVYSGTTVTKDFTLAKARAGTNGNSTAGTLVYMTQPTCVLMTYANGTVQSYSPASGNIKVFFNGVDVSSSATYAVAAQVNLTGTINSSGAYSVSALAADIGSLLLNVTYSGVTYPMTFTVSKDYVGYEIVSSLPSTGNFNGRVVFLTGDKKLYRYDSTAGSFTKAVDGADISTNSILANSINVGNLIAAFVGTNQLSASNIDTRGLTIKDSAGNVIFQAGNSLGISPYKQGGGNNVLDPSVWTAGTSGTQAAFIALGTSSSGSDSIVLASAPDGILRPVWRAVSGSSSGTSAEGGWNTTSFPIDATKTYRFTVWVRCSNGTSGNFYLGASGNTVDNLPAGTQNDNPYFVAEARTLLTPGKWYLLVGYVFPTSTTTQNYQGGTYDGVTGARIALANDYRWHTGLTYSGHRCYQYYTSAAGTTQDFWGPRVDLCDGSEPSLQELLAMTAVKVDASNAPATILNSNVTATSIGAVKTDLTNAPDGILNSNVTATGIGAVKTDASNAPSSILNSSITVSSGAIGGIGTGSGTVVDNTYAATGQNLLPNSDQTAAITWSGIIYNPNGATYDYAPQYASGVWDQTNYALVGTTTRNIFYHQSNIVSGGDDAAGGDIYMMEGTGNILKIPVIPGERYVASAYIANHRCRGQVYIGFFNSSGTNLNYYVSSAVGPTNDLANQLSTPYYNRAYVAVTAPATAATAVFYVRKLNTLAGNTESFIWIAAPQFERVNSNVSTPSLYQPGPALTARQLGYSGDLNATYGAQAGANLKDSGGTVLSDSAIKNSAITIGSGGALSGAGGGTVTIGGLGYSGDLNATYGAQAGTNLKDSTGTVLSDSAIKNSAISISSSGALSGAGGGAVTIGGLGYSGDLNATKNVITYSASAPSAPVNGDLWVDTSATPNLVKVRVAGAWQIGGSYVSSTSQIADDAGLGTTAAWSGVSGTGKPADNATRNTVYRLSTAPTSGMSTNDLWFNTGTFATYYYDGASWVLAGDRTSANTAAAITGQGTFATTSQITTTNSATLVGASAITATQVASLNVGTISNAVNNNTSSGGRVIIDAGSGGRIRIYDSSNVLRMTLGYLL